MQILEKIVARKHAEVAERRELYPVKLLEKSMYFHSPVVSLKKYLLRPDKKGIIAEIKRRSPSLGAIQPYADVEKVSIGYMQAGASALSVLTDQHFFGGSLEDLTTARKYNFCPILRKDFTIDEYQILEARSAGADAILLIAAILTKEQISALTGVAQSLGMEVLLELHDAAELDKIDHRVDMIGINNRNLSTMQVNLHHAQKLSALIPKEFTKVAESGITSAEDIVLLSEYGFRGFLIGSHFMKQARPAAACRELIERLDAIALHRTP